MRGGTLTAASMSMVVSTRARNRSNSVACFAKRAVSGASGLAGEKEAPAAAGGPNAPEGVCAGSRGDAASSASESGPAAAAHR